MKERQTINWPCRLEGGTEEKRRRRRAERREKDSCFHSLCCILRCGMIEGTQGGGSVSVWPMECRYWVHLITLGQSQWRMELMSRVIDRVAPIRTSVHLNIAIDLYFLFEHFTSSILRTSSREQFSYRYLTKTEGDELDAKLHCRLISHVQHPTLTRSLPIPA